jgi:flagellar biosynthesis chaperone FliJ
MNSVEPAGQQPAAEQDYDLLTYHEAGSRLDHEIAMRQRTIAELLAQAVDQTDPRLAANQERLSALLAARERNRRKAINDENFERFFGYPAPRNS